MNQIEIMKRLRIKQLEKIENNEIKEIEQLKQKKLSELNKNEKIKLEKLEHLKHLKLSQIKKLKIKLEEKNNFVNIENNYFENYKKLLFEMYNELKIFNKNVIENIEQIEKDEIEIEQHKNFLSQKIEEHKKFLADKIVDQISIQKYEIDQLKKKKQKPSILPLALPINKNKYKNDIKIHVIFLIDNSELNNENSPPIIIECPLNAKIAQLIETYYERIGNFSQNNKFIYKNKELSPDLTLQDENLNDGCLIKVINASFDNDI